MDPLRPKDPKSIGPFNLIGLLGSGGMGVVYLASRNSQTVALKVIRDSLIDDKSEAARFAREVETLRKVSSPNVARIIDAGDDEGSAWFAAEFVNGPNLSELVSDLGPLDEHQWWELARGLLNGLADVHQAGVTHRDIKPANIIMAEAGPKLIDFGIAHISDATSLTATGLVAGSPAWFSPEQIEGLELTLATDVFSAGSVLTFAATGLSPWGGSSTMTKASVFKILTSEPELSMLSPAQASLVGVMLEKEPTKRPTFRELIHHLESVRHGNEANRVPPRTTEAESEDGDTRFAGLSDRSRGATAQRQNRIDGDGTTEKRVGQGAKKWFILLAASVPALSLAVFLTFDALQEAPEPLMESPAALQQTPEPLAEAFPPLKEVPSYEEQSSTAQLDPERPRPRSEIPDCFFYDIPTAAKVVGANKSIPIPYGTTYTGSIIHNWSHENANGDVKIRVTAREGRVGSTSGLAVKTSVPIDATHVSPAGAVTAAHCAHTVESETVGETLITYLFRDTERAGDLFLDFKRDTHTPVVKIQID